MNLTSSITLRAAAPTLNEGLVFAQYLDQAAEGFVGLWLGRQAADIIATAYTQPGHDFSYQHIIFAEQNNAIVGMASGYTAEQHRCSPDPPLRQAAGNHVLRMMSTALLCAPLLRYLGTHAEGDFYLQAMAVDKKLRSHGVGSALMDVMEHNAREAGSSQFCLDVSPTNEGACKLYSRRGMAETSRWPKFSFMPRIIIRMAKSL